MTGINLQEIDRRILTIRGQSVLVEATIADLYGVTTKGVNQAVSNNLDKFPPGYIIELTKDEKRKVVKNFDHLTNLKFSPHLPKAFTEKGLYMLATVLKSAKAVRTTLAVIETFTKLRYLTQSIGQALETEDMSRQNALSERSGEISAEILGDELPNTGVETTLELNVAFLKLKHTIKKAKG